MVVGVLFGVLMVQMAGHLLVLERSLFLDAAGIVCFSWALSMYPSSKCDMVSLGLPEISVASSLQNAHSQINSNQNYLLSESDTTD